MAFNGSGTFTRLFNWVTDKSNTVPVTASRMDSEQDGIATGLSTCICKDGQTTTTARIPFTLGIGLGSGTVALPAANFSADTDTGLYYIGANNAGFACNGAKVLDISATGLGVTGTLSASGAAAFSSTAAITGNTTVGGTLGVTGASTLSSTLAVTGAVTLSSTLAVTGASTLTGAVTINAGGTALSIPAGSMALAGDLNIATNKFQVSSASGDTSVGGALAVASTSLFTGGVTMSSTLAISGITRVLATTSSTTYQDGALVVSGGMGVTGAIRCNNTVTAALGMSITGAGVVVGAATGNDKGAGTINCAADIYKNNTAYTNPDYVFEHFYTGQIEKFKDNPGASDYEGLMPLALLRSYTKSRHRLPGITDDPAGMFERGDVALAKLEELTLYILELHERISKLEKKH